MNKVLNFRKHKIVKEWRDPNDGNRLWVRTSDDLNLLCLPPEYDSYLEKNGILFRIEKSPNNFSWCLYLDDISYPRGWDQPGHYVRTLVLCRNGDRAEAIKRAQKICPDASVFWVGDSSRKESLPGDEAFEKWFNQIATKKDKTSKMTNLKSIKG
jgi:hypothetical protein